MNFKDKRSCPQTMALQLSVSEGIELRSLRMGVMLAKW